MSIDDLCHMDNCFSSMTAITKHSSFSFQGPFNAVNHCLGSLPAVAFRTILQHGMGHCINQSIFLIRNNIIVHKHTVIAVQSVFNSFYAVWIFFGAALSAAFSSRFGADEVVDEAGARLGGGFWLLREILMYPRSLFWTPPQIGHQKKTGY